MEAEALILGTWRNVEELEESLNLDELNAIIVAARDREHRHHKFLAAMQGVDLDKEQAKNSTTFEDVKRRAEARLSGKSVQELEFEDIGLDFEEEQ